MQRCSTENMPAIGGMRCTAQCAWTCGDALESSRLANDAIDRQVLPTEMTPMEDGPDFHYIDIAEPGTPALSDLSWSNSMNEATIEPADWPTLLCGLVLTLFIARRRLRHPLS